LVPHGDTDCTERRVTRRANRSGSVVGLTSRSARRKRSNHVGIAGSALGHAGLVRYVLARRLLAVGR
jgi:hypothetical protein